MWNDRDCSTPNFFICERLQNDEPLEDGWIPDCNRSVVLSREHPRASVSSPGFPRHYPDNVDCNTDITAPAGYRLLLDFEELVLENEPSCSYDFLEISETSLNISDSKNLNQARRLCGDWSSKLKLLRYVSSTSRLKLRFSSDYSHHFGGYKARVSMENALQCADDRFHLFNNSCYLFVSYPEVAWNTAQQICDGINANLASVLSPEEERFITTNIRKTPEYRTSALYWLGGKIKKDFGFFWMDKKPVSFTNWMPGQKPNEIFRKNNDTIKCLGIQWLPSPTPILPSGLYWRMQRCSAVGGYVCKRPNQILGLGINFNQTVNGSDGTISTPNFPGQYYNNLDFSIRIVGPKRTRLLIKFNKIDIESQLECLYDYVEIKSKATGQQQSSDAIKWCGSHDVDMHRFDFVSQTNEAELKFHSDYSISGSGFKLSWHAVDVSSCPSQTLTAREGSIASPNYPNFLLSQLNCSITIQAPAGHRIWLEFDNVDLGIDNDFDAASESANSEAMLELSLGKHSPLFTPFQNKHLLTEGSYLSNDEHLTLRLTTLNHPMGNGFQAHYKIVSTVKEEKIIRLGNMSSGLLLHLNYPDNPAVEIDFKQHLIVPLGNIISLELHHLKLGTAECLSNDDGVVEIYDNYSADENGTHWKLCYANTADARELISPSTPIEITSFLNTLHLRQKSKSLGIRLNGTLRVSEDGGFKAKIFKHSNDVESCNPNPCLNGGKCITRDKKTFCQCMGHFTGLFCALTSCELEPCLFGTCELTNSSYKCHCKSGYIGPACEQKRRPCESNPCEGRGLCMDRGDSFLCRCHAWWEGQRCEKRMLHIPYKPLSERMLHEPFWLGLMTVFVVMAVIGLVWCAKRHFPEKIEKLLAEEQERNRSTMISLRSSSVREQLAAAAAAASAGGNQGTPVTPSPGGSANPRSILGRLGTPSPKKKRNNSTPTKKNVAEKKLILQQLVSPGNKHLSKKVSLGELIQLSDGKDLKSDNNTLSVKETMFGGVDTAQSALNDPKLEKKVTFARLLNKVSAEMNSGSDMELGIMRVNKLGVAFARPSSTPPSPSVTMRSPNSTSSNQGSDSFSSDLAIPSALSSSISDLLSRRQSRLPNLTNGKPKPASADSILAMFRNFSSSSAGVNLPSSLRVSPSTTPTASSPQDDIAGDDESSTSSIHTPVSFSSGCPESPIMHRNNQSTIEISVMDSLSAHKSSSSGSNLLHPPTILLEIPSTINKCLSPIREMPTPLPSPMPSPAPQMRRTYASAQVEDIDSDDRISVELPNISISCSDGDDDDNRLQDIALDLQAEDGLILEEVAMMNCYKTRNRPSPLGQTSDNQRIIIEQTPLVIPTLVIQTPSPTRSPASFHGSPPPHKPRQETMFPFPPSSHYWQQSRKKLKDYDKPTSLDLPCAPPMITITCNMSEVESDADSPATKACGGHLGIPTTGMSYLSPFSMGARGDHTTSESNLSSSGYSSMASPGPSRCGSSNPLCPSEMEDQGPPGSGPSHRRPSPILKTNSNPSECSTGGNKNGEDQRRGRSDSETLSDDPLLESNDEGIGTDHIEEKIDDGDLKSAKELQVFITGDCDTTLLVDVPQTNLIPTLVKTPAAPQVVKCVSLDDSINRLQPPLISKHSLQLPSIVVQCDTDKLCVSPVSSRSESPLSDRTTGLERFSPQFYGRHKDLLPFTDSDGLYDFPSTDKVNVVSSTHKKIGNKKREKKPLTRNCKTPSPSKTHYAIPGFNTLLDVPSKDHYKVPPPRKLSPKRRVTRSQVVSSSSSSDSIVTAKDLRPTSSSPSPDTIRWSSPIEWIDHKLQKSQGASGEEDVVSTILPKATDFSKNQKISRLRAIGHQIRFLRRLELSLKRRDRAISPSDSIESGEDSPRATSPLLPNRGPKPEIRKSSSIGKLGSSTSRPKRSKYKKGDLLLTDQESSWKRVVITDTGHSE